jgi:hypothetical protein
MDNAYLFEALKTHLRARGLTYKNVAEALKLSEGTIKRTFSEGDCTLGRLTQICDLVGVDLREIAQGVPREPRLLRQLTRAQEQELVDDIWLFIVAVNAMGNLRFEEILGRYRLTEAQCVKLLARLDKIGFLELFPKNRYRMLVARDFQWIPDGPIMRWTKKHAVEYFDHPFAAPGEMLRVVNVRVSRQAAVGLIARIEQLARDYAEQHNADSWLPLKQRQPLSLCLAVREWEPLPFADCRRTP